MAPATDTRFNTVRPPVTPIVSPGPGFTVNFSSAFQGHLEKMIAISDNGSAAQCVHGSGYGYLDGALASRRRDLEDTRRRSKTGSPPPGRIEPAARPGSSAVNGPSGQDEPGAPVAAHHFASFRMAPSFTGAPSS